MSQEQVIGGRYEIQEMVGQGGMGAVYRGIDRQTGIPVAVKLLKADVATDPGIVARFNREAEALRLLNHPNIVTVLASIDEDNRHYIVMEYVGGGSLRDLLDEEQRLPIRRALYIALDLADALTRAHRLDIIHRDLKPANVMLAQDGTPRLTDFGVARMASEPGVTQEGTVVGTLAYLAPEAFEGGIANERTDIWAFGVILFEMLSGTLPYSETQVSALITSIISRPVPDIEMLRPDAPVGLVDLVNRMLEKDPNRRIPSVRQVGVELEALIRGDGREAAPRMAPSTRFSTPAPAGETGRTTGLLKPVRHNLPAQTTPFVGRDQELAALSEMLSTPATRLITLLGPGGMGKTRLSLEVAREALDRFADGVFFVALAPLDSAEHIVPAIADSMQFEFSGADDPKTELLFYLRDKELLLVMDNFEHLAAGAGLVSEILRAAPGVKVLVSSRERLRLQGETIYEVAGMPYPDSLDSLEQFSAVQLFLQSARRVQPDFELNADNAEPVARITRLVQGMPLGIELAAAWLEMLLPHEIVSEIETSLDFLESNLQDVPERHRSIRAVFDYSWNLLPDEERGVFAQMSVFRGGFNRDAAMAVTGASLRALTGLVNRSLINRSADGRYSIHTLLRQYAEARLAEMPAVYNAVRDKHAQFYGEFLALRGIDIQNKHQRRTMNEMDVELENVRSAWQWASERRQYDIIHQSLDTLTMYYEFSGLSQECVTTLDQLGERLMGAGCAPDDLLLWRVRVHAARIEGRRGVYETSLNVAREGLEVFRRHDSKPDMVLALNTWCYAQMWLGDWDESRRVGLEAVELAETCGDIIGLMIARGNVSYVAFLQGDYAEAEKWLEAFLEVPKDEKYDSPVGRAFGLNNKGELWVAQGRQRAAVPLFEEAYDIFKTYNHRRGMAFSLNNLGGILYGMAEYDQAEEKYRQSYALNKAIGDRAGIGHSLSALGNVAFFRGDVEGARRYYTEALALRREMGDPRAIADSLGDLGDTARMAGDPDEARRLYEEGLALRQEIGDRAGESRTLAALGCVALLQGDRTEAGRLLAEGRDLALEIGDAFNAGIPLFGLGFIDVEEGRLEAAREKVAALHDMTARYGAPIGQIMGLCVEGHVRLAQDDTAGAREMFTAALKLTDSTEMRPLASLALMGVAEVRTRTGDPAGGVELMAAALRDPLGRHYPQPRAHMESVMKRMQLELPADVYAAAVRRGESEEIPALVRRVLGA